MFVFAAAVPALLVVLVGYVAGYTLTEWVGGLVGADVGPPVPEVVGWLTGMVLLGVVVHDLARRWRRRRARRLAAEPVDPG